MSAIVNASHLVIGLFALWFLYFVCWRELRVDTFRQRLFAVRDDLFDYAASGAIGFNDPAYSTLRELSNSLIRFAHRATFARVWAAVWFGNLPRTNPMETWMARVNTLEPEVRDRLLKAHDDIRKASIRYVVALSPLAWIYMLVGLVISLLKIRVKIEHKEISAVIEQEALEQSSFVDNDECLSPV
jgi:hypothetical protein